MDKTAYLRELENALSGLPESDIQDILSDYREHFSVGLSEGRTTEEIAGNLGDPVVIGRLYRADHLVQQADSSNRIRAIVPAVFAVIGLGLFNIFFVAVPSLLIAFLVLGLWILTGLVILTGIGCLAGTLAYVLFPSWFVIGGASGISVFFLGLFLSLGFLSMGALLAIGVWFLTRFLIRQAVRYLKFNISLFTVRREP